MDTCGLPFSVRAIKGIHVQIVSGGVTDVGRVRANNEDCYRIIASEDLFVLSDGMGGGACGEVASALAVETVVKSCLDGATPVSAGSIDGMQPAWSDRTKRLFRAVHLANHRIFDSALQDSTQRGMGATLTAAWIDNARLSIAHVGDSRAYLLRGGALMQLSTDHSLVAEQVRKGMITAAEAEESAMQSVLLRALGTEPEVEVDAEEHVLYPRDVLLLCSDGLTRMVTEPEIAGMLQAELDPTKAAENLVELANDRGGSDNVTVIVIRANVQSSGWFPWLRRGSPKAVVANSSAGGK